MGRLGGVFRRDGRFVAKVETQESGVRYKMEGPLRAVEQEAVQDLDYIRSAAEGEPTWAEGLQSMKLAAKEVPTTCVAPARGGVIAIASRSF